jgi:hypothetical protein
MNQTKTAKRLLTVLIAAAAMSLAACGGGDSGSPASLLPAGAVGTKGDNVNLSEYEAITGGMNMDQVKAIVGDAPNVVGTEYLGWVSNPAAELNIIFLNNGVKRKILTSGGKSLDEVNY